MYRLYIGEDHALVREGLKLILAQRPDFEVAGEASDGLELLKLVRRQPPDAVILDISMPKMRGIEAIGEIKDVSQNVKVLILTMHKDEVFLTQAFTAGADGYLLKEDIGKELFLALDAVLAGKTYVSSLLGKALEDSWVKVFRGGRGVPGGEVLSPREREVLKLVAEGESSKEIADRLCISVRTVDHHRAKVMEKLKLKGTADLIRYAITRGYVS